MDEILSILKEKNLKATPQRLAILKYLNHHTHPTIDEIYENVKKDFPSISLATIYKNLNILKEYHIVSELNPGGKMRYDINIKPHFHGKCINCGKIIDFYNEDIINSCKNSIQKSIKNKIVDIDINISIFCDECAKA